MSVNNWARRAACLNTPIEVMHPTSGPTSGRTCYEAARRFCVSCPVSERCLLDAQRDEKGNNAAARVGMRGGLTPPQRAGLYRLGNDIADTRQHMHTVRCTATEQDLTVQLAPHVQRLYDLLRQEQILLDRRFTPELVAA